jgi:hypothetical protein
VTNELDLCSAMGIGIRDAYRCRSLEVSEGRGEQLSRVVGVALEVAKLG